MPRKNPPRAPGILNLSPLVGLALLISSRAMADIVITEIHYAPVDSAGVPRSDLEFVELSNDGPEPYDLYLYRFTGIDFEFSERTFIPARGLLAVCRNAAAVSAYYGISNIVGDFGGVLDNSGEVITLLNPQGAIVSQVPYNDKGRWPSGAKGTGHSLSSLSPHLDPANPESWVLSAQMGGTPGTANFAAGATFDDTIILDAGTSWRFLKGTQEASDPTDEWRDPASNDATWLSGLTGIGYGDGDDATNLADMRNGYLTVFCRKFFNIADTSAVEDLVLSIIYDDGFIAYLNGTQVASRNVTGSAFDAQALSAIEPTSEDIDISGFKHLLRNGANLLAVQVHNANLDSSDLSFIPRLLSRRTILPSEIETVPVVINEGYLLAGVAERFIELHNTSTAAVNLSGYHFTDAFSDLMRYTIEDGTSIPGRGFLRFTETELGLDLSIAPGSKERVNVALTNPAGTRVVDAFIFEPHAPGKSEARLPDGARRFAAAADPTPAAPNQMTIESGVVLNEIHYHSPANDDLDEFIELFNSGSSAVDLGGWVVEGVGLTFPPGTWLGAGDYLVIAAEPERILSRYGLPPSAVHPAAWSGSLRNSGERINLYDANGNQVDTVRYFDGGEWPGWPDGGGSSLELIDPESENDVAGSWDSSDDSADAAPQTITYGNVPYGGGESDFGMMLADEGIVLIDDISLVRTGTGVNLISNGAFDSGVSGWRFEGTHIRSGRTSAAGERITGAGSLKLISLKGGGDYKVNRIETETAPQSSGTYTVTYKARWVVGSPRIITIGDYNVSQGANPGIAGSSEVVLPDRLGTPGAVNSVTARRIAATGSSNTGPAIDRVSHSPGVPEGSEPVTVSARIRDPDSVGDVRVHYRTETPAGVFTAVSMTDADGDRVFTASLPGQALGVKVLFFIEAEDGAGASSRFPASVLARTHPPVLDPGSPAANDELYGMYRHDTRIVSTTKHSYRFILNDLSEDYLRARPAHSNDMLEGTFVFGSSDIYYNSRIRFAGSPWLRSRGNFGNSYTIKMPRDNPLHGRKLGFNLDNHGSDGRERISHYLLRQSAGNTLVPYYDFHALVRFQLNDVRDATYEAFDRPGGQYISFWFPDADRGPFFEMDDRFSFNDLGEKTGNADGHVLYPPYGPTTGGPNRENYRWFFSPRSNASADYFAPLQSFCYLMDSRTTPNASFDRDVWGAIDVEEILRVFAIELNIDDWDTWGGTRGKNCYFHQSQTDGLWRKIPWDLELTYGNVNAFPMPSTIAGGYSSAFSEVSRMMSRPRIKRLYYGILAEQVDPTNGFFHSAFLSPYMQLLSAAGVGNTGIGQTGGFVDQRANLIRNWVRGAIYPQVRLQITTNGGNPLVTPDPTIDLDGTAPADIFFLAVSRNGLFLDEGLEPELSTSNVTGWRISAVPLVPGVNDIEVLGLGSRGNIVDLDSIQVTSSTDGTVYIRGDANTDGAIDISDGLKVLLHLFSGEAADCLDALDANDSGTLDITDAIVILDHLFKGGAAPPEPYPEAGSDPTPDDDLECEDGLP